MDSVVPLAELLYAAGCYGAYVAILTCGDQLLVVLVKKIATPGNPDSVLRRSKEARPRIEASFGSS